MDKKKRVNGRKKDYKIKSVNFGSPRDPIRMYVEDLEKKIAKQEFSKMMKTAFTLVYVDEKTKEKYKIISLKAERKMLLEHMQTITHKIRLNADELEKNGVDDFE